MKLRILLGGLAICAVALPLAADITYTYTGNDFETAIGGYTTSDYVSGFFTLAAALGDNLLFPDNITPLSYSFTDGVQTFTSATPPTNVTFQVATDGSGDITNWEVNLGTGPPQNDSVSTNPSSDTGEMISAGAFGNIIGDPGTWVMSGGTSPVPEPRDVGFIILGLMAMAAVARSRTRRLGSQDA